MIFIHLTSLSLRCKYLRIYVVAIDGSIPD